MCRENFPRIYELRELTISTLSSEAFFYDFDSKIEKEPLRRRQFQDIERELQGLDQRAWNHLKEDVTPHLLRRDPKRGWQALFDKLNHAKAYNYLARIGCIDIRFICESKSSGKKTPDLQGHLGSRKCLCEVKTINVSDDEASARSVTTARDIANLLNDGFFKKLKCDLRRAREQINTYYSESTAKKIVYIVVNYDDAFHEHAENYIEQINKFIETSVTPEMPEIEITFDIKPPFYTAMT